MMIKILIFFLLITYFFILLSGKINIQNLQPVLVDGFVPVLKASYPRIITFPFGEMMVFLMFWCFVEPKDKIRKVSYMALLTSSILLCFSLIIIVSVLGVTIASNSLIPLLDVVKQINILGILRNFDAIAILNMLIGGFFKFTIFFYAGVSCFSTLFKLKDYRRILIPVGLVTLYVSFYTMPNILVQKWVGPEITAKYINIPLQIAIPSSLLIISMLKNYKVNKTKQSHTNKIV